MRFLCTQPPRPTRAPDQSLDLESLLPERADLIRISHLKWMNGMKIRWAIRGGTAADRKQVAQAVATWQVLAPGLHFEQVDSWSDAEVRILFGVGGSWSHVGTDCLYVSKDQPTMKIGGSLEHLWGSDTALHLWGHVLGYQHEHQNPTAGIEWDEYAVLEYYKGPPNYWSEEQIRDNILEPVPVSAVTSETLGPYQYHALPIPGRNDFAAG